MAALCVWLAPLWLTITLTSAVALGFLIEMVVKGIKESGAQPTD
ncbi:MAG: hypothetical protein V1748_11670 [Actinomycetota bacterium]